MIGAVSKLGYEMLRHDSWFTGDRPPSTRMYARTSGELKTSGALSLMRFLVSRIECRAVSCPIDSVRALHNGFEWLLKHLSLWGTRANATVIFCMRSSDSLYATAMLLDTPLPLLVQLPAMGPFPAHAPATFPHSRLPLLAHANARAGHTDEMPLDHFSRSRLPHSRAARACHCSLTRMPALVMQMNMPLLAQPPATATDPRAIACHRHFSLTQMPASVTRINMPLPVPPPATLCAAACHFSYNRNCHFLSRHGYPACSF